MDGALVGGASLDAATFAAIVPLRAAVARGAGALRPAGAFGSVTWSEGAPEEDCALLTVSSWCSTSWRRWR